MGDLFDGYAPADILGVRAWDEMFEAAGVPRPAARTLRDSLQALAIDEFESRCAARDRSFRDRGITFQLSGEERPFPLDLVPRIIPEKEWSVLSAGVAQRVTALEAFLADVYGAGQILDGPGRSPPAGDHVRAVPPGRVRGRTAERGAHPRGRDRRGTRRGRDGSTCWRTTSAARPASRTSSRTAA